MENSTSKLSFNSYNAGEVKKTIYQTELKVIINFGPFDSPSLLTLSSVSSSNIDVFLSGLWLDFQASVTNTSMNCKVFHPTFIMYVHANLSIERLKLEFDS